MLVVLTADGSAPPRRLDQLDVGRVVEPGGLARTPTRWRSRTTATSYCSSTLGAARPSPRPRWIGAQPVRPHRRGSPGRRTAAGSPTRFPDTAQTTAIKLCQVETRRDARRHPAVLRDTAPGLRPARRLPLLHRPARLQPRLRRSSSSTWASRSARRPFAIALRSDVPSPFVPRPQGRAESEAAAAQEKAEAASEAEPAPPPAVEIDLDGIERRRLIGLPGARGPATSASPGIKGKALFSVSPVEGSRRHDWYNLTPPATGALDVYDFDDPEARAPGRRHHRLLARPRRARRCSTAPASACGC